MKKITINPIIGNPYKIVQKAINDAECGDEIHFSEGVFDFEHKEIMLKQGVSLFGSENRKTIIVRGSFNGLMIKSKEPETIISTFFFPEKYREDGNYEVPFLTARDFD